MKRVEVRSEILDMEIRINAMHSINQAFNLRSRRWRAELGIRFFENVIPLHRSAPDCEKWPERQR